MKVLFLGPACADLIDCMKDFGDEVVQTEDKITGDSPVLDNTEFLVSYRYRHILKPDVLDRFPRRVINLHISCLPWNRGCHPNVWSFIEDSQKGVTIHYIDPGVDTGDILAQEEVQFSSTETLRTSYNTLSARIEELFKRTWPDIRSGRMEARPQPPGGSVHKMKDLKTIEHLFVKGWDTPVADLIGKGVEPRDRGSLMERQ